MKRDLLKRLIKWKDSSIRTPLILKGARQVGKSWLVQEFAKEFKSFVVLNFDKERKAANYFKDDLQVKELVKNLSVYFSQKITPGETLLFLDEIQECPRAIAALRYFKEEMPELHVIASGSLLEFALQEVGMPVGRVQFMHLYPMSFGEFLTALGQDELRQHIFQGDIHEVIHERVLELLKNYLWLGGMPAVVDAWLKHEDVSICQEAQNNILLAYFQDFHKYAKQRQIPYVAKVFEAIPAHLGSKFKYSNVDNEIRSVLLREALGLLVKAGIVYFCKHSSGHELPLGAFADEKKFKAYFLDVGLAQRMLGLRIDDWQKKPVAIATLGKIAEQFVAQEIMAYSADELTRDLYYWHRESKSSNAEVDFLVQKNSQIVPVEVKAGTTGRMKSLHLFLESHPSSSFGIKISEGQFGDQNKIHEIPFYAIESWLRGYNN